LNLRDGYIAVDWGTTNRRAYRIDGTGMLVNDFSDDLGVKAVPDGGFEAAVAEIRTKLGDLPMLMAGMVGSNRGWFEAPYIQCPAGIEALTHAILWAEPGRTGIVPGVSQRGAAGADVMRGEEVQVIGAIADGSAPPEGLICHPGTHAKWIVTADARITAFRTMMTGEMFALLSEHSILAEQLTGDAQPGAAFEAGVNEALCGGDVLSGLFRIRARYLLGESKGDEVSYASGLLIGSDVRAGLLLDGAGSITLLGRLDLCELYAIAIGKAGRETRAVDGAAAFLTGIRCVAETL